MTRLLIKTKTMNYFELLNMDTSFEIDLELLKQNYLILQKKFHPDNMSNDDMETLLQSAIINKAYETLKDEYQRASYLLKLSDIDVQSETARHDEISEEFLNDILDKKERINETNNFDDLLNLQSEETNNRISIISNINQCFIQNTLREARIETMKLKYIDNIIKTIENKISQCL